MKYESRPKETGYYWMRFRRKYARRFTCDVVWYSANAPDEFRRVDWHKMADFPSAMFYGPLDPPKENQQ